MLKVKKTVWIGCLVGVIGLCVEGGGVLAVPVPQHPGAATHPQALLDTAFKTQHESWAADAKQNSHR